MAYYHHQSMLVSSAFEEGHFEIGLTMLEHLRSEEYKPTVPHLLQLFFISLNPSTGSKIATNPDDIPSGTLDASNPLMSPRKVAKMTRSTTTITPNAINTARKLLLSFTLVNTPQDLAAALPRCLGPGEEPPTIDSFGDSGWNSTPIYTQSMGMISAKSCWELLKEGYVDERNRLALLASPSKKSKVKGSRLYPQGSAFDLDEMRDDDDEEEGVEAAPVGPDSWFLLEWMIRVFQKDSDAQEAKGEQRHSPLLVQQFPVSRDGKLERWDTVEPLKIVFFALQQNDPRRQQLGVELLILLIEASCTPHLSTTMFTASVCSHIMSSPTLSDSTTDPFQDLISRLPNTPSITPFKITLCRKFLRTLVENSPSIDPPTEGTSTGTGTGAPSALPPKPKPQPRRTMPRPIFKKTDDAASTATSTETKTDQPAPGAPPPRRNIGTTYLPSTEDVFDSIRLHIQPPAQHNTRRQPRQRVDHRPLWITEQVILRVKYELVLSCALVLAVNAQETSASPGAGATGGAQGNVEGWLRAIRDGTATKVLEEVFPESGDGPLFKMLLGSALGGASSKSE